MPPSEHGIEWKTKNFAFTVNEGELYKYAKSGGDKKQLKLF